MLRRTPRESFLVAWTYFGHTTRCIQLVPCCRAERVAFSTWRRGAELKAPRSNPKSWLMLGTHAPNCPEVPVLRNTAENSDPGSRDVTPPIGLAMP